MNVNRIKLTASSHVPVNALVKIPRSFSTITNGYGFAWLMAGLENFKVRKIMNAWAVNGYFTLKLIIYIVNGKLQI